MQKNLNKWLQKLEIQIERRKINADAITFGLLVLILVIIFTMFFYVAVAS